MAPRRPPPRHPGAPLLHPPDRGRGPAAPWDSGTARSAATPGMPLGAPETAPAPRPAPVGEGAATAGAEARGFGRVPRARPRPERSRPARAPTIGGGTHASARAGLG